MELADAFDEVVRIARDSASAERAFQRLAAFLAENVGAPSVRELEQVDITADVESVRSRLQRLKLAEPPPPLTAIYFGLFDTEKDGREVVGYYVSGVDRDREARDFLCKPVWWPKGRYLGSRTLDAVKAAELGAKGADERAFLAYAGQLGCALVVTKFASQGVFEGLPRVVGFDSGDFAEIDV